MSVRTSNRVTPGVSGTPHNRGGQPRRAARCGSAAWWGRSALLLLACHFGLAAAYAVEVRAEVSARETQVGVPIELRVALVDAGDAGAPEIPSIPNVTVRLLGPPSQSSQFYSGPGGTSQSTTLTYRFEVTPQAIGTFTIPALSVAIGSRTYRTDPIRVAVTQGDTTEVVALEVLGDPDTVYVGEPVDLTLRVWIRPFVDPQERVKLNVATMWSRVDFQASSWGVFAEPLQNLLQRRQMPAGNETLREDQDGTARSFYRYDIHKTVWPTGPGTVDFGDVRLVVSYPVRLERDRSFMGFGDLSIAATRKATAAPQPCATVVRPVPTVGRPDDFRGAVGRYAISASATPTDVTVGEPITLTLTVRGDGNLALVAPPPLADLPVLTGPFRVPTDPLAGEVLGNAKQFTQTIRARGPEVTEIPPLPFSFFDPQTATFQTVYTSALPLKVRPAGQLAPTQITDAPGAQHAEQTTQTLTPVAGGLLANYRDVAALLRTQTMPSAALLAGGLAVPPTLFMALWFLQWRRARLARDPAGQRRRAARALATQILHEANGHETGDAAGAVARAIGEYVAARFDQPAGGLTRADVARLLESRRAPADVRASVERLLQDCETLRYAPAGDRASAELRGRAEAVLGRLVREGV